MEKGDEPPRKRVKLEHHEISSGDIRQFDRQAALNYFREFADIKWAELRRIKEIQKIQEEAKAGNREAQYELALRYGHHERMYSQYKCDVWLSNKDFEKNPGLALFWCEKAANQGHVDAKENLKYFGTKDHMEGLPDDILKIIFEFVQRILGLEGFIPSDNSRYICERFRHIHNKSYSKCYIGNDENINYDFFFSFLSKYPNIQTARIKAERLHEFRKRLKNNKTIKSIIFTELEDHYSFLSIAKILKKNMAIVSLIFRNTQYIKIREAYILAEILEKDTRLRALDISCALNPKDMLISSIFVAKALKHNTTLAELNLSGNIICKYIEGENSEYFAGIEFFQSLAKTLEINTTLTSLNLSKVFEFEAYDDESLKDKIGLIKSIRNIESVIESILESNKTLTFFDITRNGFSTDLEQKVSKALIRNRSLLQATS